MGSRVTREEQQYRLESSAIRTEYKSAIPINILLVGPRRSGKTALVKQFLDNEYSNIYAAPERTGLCNRVFKLTCG